MHGELKYWMVKRKRLSGRAVRMKSFILDNVLVCADIGCGPRGGIFEQKTYPKMYGVDPLWQEYEKLNLDTAKDIVRITATAENFVLPELADLIVSFNAMDHSGNLSKGIENIKLNLSPGGVFIMHMHLRTKKQLDNLHSIYYTLDSVKAHFDTYKLFDKDPIMGPKTKKKYKTFIGWLYA